METVLVLGMAVVDFVFAVDAMPSAPIKYRAHDAKIVGGGIAANAAVGIARLGGTARLAARLGDDPLADLILDDLRASGVDCDLVQRTPSARSSFSSVYVDATGERQIMNFRGAGLTDKTDWIAPASPCDAVLVDTRWPDGAAKALELAKTWGVPGIVDGEAPMEPTLLRKATHVAFSRQGLTDFVGSKDLRQALREAAERLPGRWIAVTDGAAGVLHLDAGEILHTPAFAVEVKDTLGAGDIWHGAFALALAEGQGELNAIRFANATAALKCTRFGGRNGSPDRATVETFLKEHP